MSDIHEAAEFLNKLADSTKDEEEASILRQHARAINKQIGHSVKDKSGNHYELEGPPPTKKSKLGPNETWGVAPPRKKNR